MKMGQKLKTELSRRERQVMAVVYKRKNVSVWDIKRDLPDPPSYSAVRSVMNILESKGFLKHKREGHKYVYSPSIHPKTAMKAAVQYLMKTHFGDSIEKAVTTILEIHNDQVTEEELDRLSVLIERIKREGET
jgi:predicted transcriptional regulator